MPLIDCEQNRRFLANIGFPVDNTHWSACSPGGVEEACRWHDGPIWVPVGALTMRAALILEGNYVLTLCQKCADVLNRRMRGSEGLEWFKG